MNNPQPTTHNRQRLKTVIITGLLSLLAIGYWLPAYADTLDNKNSFYYVFRLYYDNGQLNADRDFQFKYDIIPGEYVADSISTEFPYRGEIINMLGEVANHFVFDPKQGDINFTKGKISVKAPYVADGEKAVFFDQQNQAILTIFVSESSFCNDDGICDADRGEDSLSCPKDCKQALPAPPVVTPAPTASGSSGIWLSIVYLVVGLLLLGGLWWFVKRRRSTPSLSNFPQPPMPPSPGSTQ